MIIFFSLKTEKTVTVVSALLSSIVLVIAILVIFIWFLKRRRRKPPNDLQLRKKLQNEDALDRYSIEEKSNNQNEENLRRYHNPLNISASSSKDKGCSIISLRDSTEMLELEIESKDDIPKNIYKAQPPEINKNIASSVSETNKDVEKNNALRFSAGTSQSQPSCSSSRTLDVTKNPLKSVIV